MNCPRCNALLNGIPNFCPKCGMELSQVITESPIAMRSIDLSVPAPPPIPEINSGSEMPSIPEMPPLSESNRLWHSSTAQPKSESASPTPPPLPPETENTVEQIEEKTDAPSPRIVSAETTPGQKQVINIIPRHLIKDATADFEVTIYHVIGFVAFFFGVGFIAMLKKGNIAVSIFFLLACGVTLYYSFIRDYMHKGNEVYEPKKSFELFRHSETFLKIAFAVIAIVAILLIIFFWNSKIGGRKFHHIFLLAGVVIGVYQAYKALDVHGNVDYEANEALMDALNVDIDECVSVSTQTFDETEESLKDGDKMIVVTNKKIYYALWYGGKWAKGIEYLKDINSIGLKSTSLKGRTLLYLTFNDGMTIMIHLDIANKMTTTPMMFAKKFLETIDDHMLGQIPEKKSRRRRVASTEQDQKPSGQSTASQSIVKGISDAGQVSARKIDL